MLALTYYDFKVSKNLPEKLNIRNLLIRELLAVNLICIL